MKQLRARSLVVVGAVVALVLVSFGTATAAGLTTKQVKKIAARVVHKKARTLAVASATNAANAANAANLAGLPSSAYLDNATIYTVAVTDPAGGHTVTIPAAPGSYQISYSALLAGASGVSFCRVERFTGALLVQAVGDDTASTTFPSMSGTGVLTLGPGDTLRLHCLTDGGLWTTLANEPIQVVVTPLDSVSNQTLTATRGLPPGSRRQLQERVQPDQR